MEQIGVTQFLPIDLNVLLIIGVDGQLVFVPCTFTRNYGRKQNNFWQLVLIKASTVFKSPWNQGQTRQTR